MASIRLKSEGAKIAIYESTLEIGTTFFGSEVIGDLEKFKKICNNSVANRYDDSYLMSKIKYKLAMYLEIIN